MRISKKTLLFISFAVVDFFAALEITSFIVASPRVAEHFGIAPEKISWIINSYLYVVFGVLVLLYFASKRIVCKVNIKTFFLFGLLLFLLGSVLGAISSSAEVFYAARVIQGIGAAISFIGQLWVMSYSFKNEIEKPLFWTETGAAAGVVLGPFLGGIFSDMATDGWRMLFILNAVVIFIAMILTELLYAKQKSIVSEKSKSFRSDIYYAIGIVIIIIAVAVGGQFVASVYLQEIENYSGFITGLILLSGSIGLIAGSASAIKRKKKRKKMISDGLGAMILSVVLLGVVFHWSLISLMPFAFFALGYYYGLLNVALYAYIAHMLDQSALVKGITFYLIATQIGNVFGIYLERIWSFLSYSFVGFGFILIFVLAIALALAKKMKEAESKEGDLYEIIPLRKTVFGIAAKAVDFIQALFFVSILIPFRFFFGIKSYGVENVRLGGQMFIISNHGSRLDAWLILSSLGLRGFFKLHPFRIPIAKTVLNYPLLKWSLACMGVYNIESKGKLELSLENTLQHVDKGYSILFFPQGRMLKKDEIIEPKKGICHVIKNKNLKILPVRVEYSSYNRAQRGSLWNARVIFGEPVYTQKIKDESAEDCLHHAAMAYVDRLKFCDYQASNAIFPQSIEVIRQFSQEKLEQLLSVIRLSFPPNWRYKEDQEFYAEILRDCQKNSVIFLKEADKVVGCLVATPHNCAVANVGKDDPHMTKDADRCYVESVAVLPGHRKKNGHFKLIEALIRENQKKNLFKYSMHVRKKNGFSSQIQLLFGKQMTLIRSLSWKWGQDEVMDYIEGIFKKPIWHLKISLFLYQLNEKIKVIFNGYKK